MLGDFWMPMIYRFKGGASGYNQNFRIFNSWPTGRISSGNVNGVMSTFLRVPFGGSTSSAEQQLLYLRHVHAFDLYRYGLWLNIHKWQQPWR